MDSQTQDYATLPGQLINEILSNVDPMARRASSLLHIDRDQVDALMNRLRQSGLIGVIGETEYISQSVMAVDGSNAVEKMAAADMLIAVAVGVEGMRPGNDTAVWHGQNQYIAWSDLLPHEECNIRLLQGAMHLMEMKILSESDYEIMIMDGPHITPILKLNSLLSIQKREGVYREYVPALRRFMDQRLKKEITNLPEMFKQVYQDPRIISVIKYSSSRDFLEGVAQITEETKLDDKAFFSVALQENEYTKPQPFGQSVAEKGMWDDVHIKVNKRFTAEAESMNKLFEEALESIKPRNTPEHSSSLYYLYFKINDRLAYRIEIKEGLARDQAALETVLYSLKRQTAFPFMIEPIPQFIADTMAKNASKAVYTMKEALLRSEHSGISEEYLHLWDPYRS